MTTPTILAIILFVFSGQTVIVVFAAHSLYEACSASRSCGNVTVSYPFFIDQRFCGFPGFQIACSDDRTPILNISGETFVIHEISYDSNDLLVSNAGSAPISQAGACVVLDNSLHLTGTPYQIGDGEEDAMIYEGCNTTALGEDLWRFRIGCDTGSPNASVLAVPGADDDRLPRASHGFRAAQICSKAHRVAVQTRGIIVVSTRKLAEGFRLTWKAGDCAWCNRTGGKCGYDYELSRLQCLCPDGPHAEACDPLNDTTDPPSLQPVIKRKSRTPWVAIIATSCGVVGIALFFVVFGLKKIPLNGVIFFWNKHNEARQNIEAFLKNCGPLQLTRYSFFDVKKMTKSFREILGKGGFGDVYKGKLRDGRLVAVKMLNHKKGDDGEGFINEVATISRTSHINIVTLLGFCFEGEKRALIYEFMPNGSLEKFVFDETIIAEHSRHLNWEKHYEIALGIARGLEYLHRGCNTRIVHFDIKPHNILLDADFVPKISDFGLAKICAKKESVISMMVPRGTCGYIAPEVVSRNFGEVSHKSDVYSYGMMVLEMVGHRRNLDVKAENISEIYFPHWIHRRVELGEDLGLKNIVNEDDESKVRNMIMVSLWCIQADPRNRPTMTGVIEMLNGSLDSLSIPPKPSVSAPQDLDGHHS